MRRTLTAFLVVLAVVILLALLIPTPSRPKAARSFSSPLKTNREDFLTNFPDKIISPTEPVHDSPGQSLSNIDRGIISPTPAANRLKAAAVSPASTEPDLTNPPPAVIMENLRSTFRLYASTFGGNPVGTNPEITRALMGGNPKQITFIHPEDGLRVNEKGEMIDSWGTPFFFHQLSGTQMEIHSAGPDRLMWTADDLVTK